MNALEIQPAIHGGYVVYVATSSYRGSGGGLMFAGTLAECLDFLRRWYSNEIQATASDVRAAS